MGHAGPVHLGVDVADQVSLGVEILDERQRIVGLCVSGVPAENLDRVVACKLAPEAGRKQPVPHVVAKDGHFVKIGLYAESRASAWKVDLARNTRGAQSAFG
jgi:hypothetical protein